MNPLWLVLSVPVSMLIGYGIGYNHCRDAWLIDRLERAEEYRESLGAVLKRASQR